MRKTFGLFFLMCAGCFGAITAATQWEVRTIGSALNGGGFDSTIANAGTDMSIFGNKNLGGCADCQSAVENISVTDATTTTTGVVGSVTGAFTSALVGNVVYLTIGGGSCSSGTVTASWRQVVSVESATSMTLSSTPAGSGDTCTGVTLNIGGALLSPVTAPTVPGNTVWIKATATYSVAAQLLPPTSGTSGLYINYVGYGTVRGDAIHPSFSLAADVIAFRGTPAYLTFQHLTVECNSRASSQGVYAEGNYVVLYDMVAHACVTGFRITGNYPQIINSTSYDQVNTGGSACFHLESLGGSIHGSLANNCAGYGFRLAGTHNRLIHSVARNSGNDGIFIDGGGTTTIISCTLVGNGLSGIKASLATDGYTFISNVIANNARYGIELTSTGTPVADYNAFYNNTLGARSGAVAGPHDVTFLGDPFMSVGSGNVALNSTYGLLGKNAAYSGSTIIPSINYQDLGAVHHSVSGVATFVQ